MEISINQNGWAVTSLEYCYKNYKGWQPTTYRYSFQTSGINFLKVENISDGRVNLKSIATVEKKLTNLINISIKVMTFVFNAGTIGETV